MSPFFIPWNRFYNKNIRLNVGTTISTEVSGSSSGSGIKTFLDNWGRWWDMGRIGTEVFDSLHSIEMRLRFRQKHLQVPQSLWEIWVPWYLLFCLHVLLHMGKKTSFHIYFYESSRASIPNIYNMSSISSINVNPFKNKPLHGKNVLHQPYHPGLTLLGWGPQLWWFGWCITHELHFQLLLGSSGEFWEG